MVEILVGLTHYSLRQMLWAAIAYGLLHLITKIRLYNWKSYRMMVCWNIAANISLAVLFQEVNLTQPAGLMALGAYDMPFGSVFDRGIYSH